MRRWTLLVLMIGLLGVVAAACGDDSSDGSESDAVDAQGGVSVSTEAPGDTSGSGAGSEPVTVNVTATDFGFDSSITTFQVGVPYHFVVENTGDEAHEFMIVEPIEAGMMSMEDMDDMALADIEEDDLEVGDLATVDVTFDQAYPEGTLEFACHIGQHYEKGMYLPIVVE